MLVTVTAAAAAAAHGASFQRVLLALGGPCVVVAVSAQPHMFLLVFVDGYIVVCRG